MKKYSISGIFARHVLTGIQRYCWEIIAELDNLLYESNISIELVVPHGVEIEQSYKNVKIVHYGWNIKFFWINIVFLYYLFKNHSTGIHMSTSPLLKPDIVCIHDVNSIVNPHFFSRFYTLKATTLTRAAVRKGKKIFSVSQFSADEIENHVGHSNSGIAVIPNAWQHINRIEAVGDSNSLFGLKAKRYFFSLSSIAPTKNFKWIQEAAKQNPEDIFVIAGGINPKVFGISNFNTEASNIKYIGRISDMEAKVLMRDCKAFLFPSHYEGFGIPPLEALACGAPCIIVSDIPVMHEVFETAVCYINPNNYEDINMAKIMEQKVTDSEWTLAKYSWKESAKKLMQILLEM